LAFRRSPKSRAIAEGYKSGLEGAISDFLIAQGIDARAVYESLTIPFTQPVKPRRYKPDFPLPNGIVVESKGQFKTADRQKHLLVQQQHPDLDLRFVFSNPNARISKQSKTTYAAWCEKNGFLYAKSTKEQPIPLTWLAEPPNRRSLAAIRLLLENPKR
jgi:hypothetical protein